MTDPSAPIPSCAPSHFYNSPGGATAVAQSPTTGASGGVNGGLGGSESRPRNIALLAWIKY
ncbi:hypothetical protein JQ582_41310 [Bradyrhizobium japonicum]|uniref:hypothetical protein n=1 Tax=Bradyrhizobium japonicum TaxID=375 RepID=UPI001BA7CAAD|nr:hypothetical protein [Bradyrhizobium japonicum]MBR0750348.1 hypothetical protein [Bradyrhizobium japonicum]